MPWTDDPADGAERLEVPTAGEPVSRTEVMHIDYVRLMHERIVFEVEKALQGVRRDIAAVSLYRVRIPTDPPGSAFKDITSIHREVLRIVDDAIDRVAST